MLTTRELNSDGFGAKDRSWNSKELLSGWREQWAESANRALDRAGRSERIDHRTLAAQRAEAIERGQGARAEKPDRDPEIHLGKAAWMARRRGEGNARTRRNDRICAGNRAREMERGRLGRAIRALDAEIRNERIREAVARGSAWASEKVKAGAALVRSIPQRRQEAKAARVQRKAASEWEAVEAGKKYSWTPDHTGATPLHRAAEADHAKTIDRLIKAGADLDAQDWKGRTPLHRAVENGLVDSTSTLLKHGANPQQLDFRGRTPTTMAENAGREDLVNEIHKANAKREREEAERQRQWELDAPKRAAAAARWEQKKAQEAAEQRAVEERRRAQLKAIEAAQQKEWAEKDAKIAAKREREDAMGKAEFVRSLDPKSSKEQTWNER